MAVLSIQPVQFPPVATSVQAPSGTALGSDSVPAAPNLMLYVGNTSGASRTVTVKTPHVVHGQAVPDVDIVLAVNGFRLVALPMDLQEADGLIKLGCNNVAGVELAALAR
jgi:hypothetical protein